MSGEARGTGSSLLRAGLSVAEVPYSLITRSRNLLFDAGLRKPVRLPTPVISVGNITTGGTGKTPAVRWLAERLRESGKTVAILSRGYKSRPGEFGDEPRMLEELVNRDALGVRPVIVRGDPKRVRAATTLLRERGGGSIDAFVLDDGFQHRQLARDFDLVLIDATEPFGYGHVFPRGMLRESLAGLRRANAFLLTRVDFVDATALDKSRALLRRHAPSIPLYESIHAPVCFREAESSEEIPLDAVRDRRCFAFCGIASPALFVRQIQVLGGAITGSRAFADHQVYREDDVSRIATDAALCSADLLVTTEKDWVKLARMESVRTLKLSVWRLDVRLKFPRPGEERALLSAIESRLR